MGNQNSFFSRPVKEVKTEVTRMTRGFRVHEVAQAAAADRNPVRVDRYARSLFVLRRSGGRGTLHSFLVSARRGDAMAVHRSRPSYPEEAFTAEVWAANWVWR